MFLPPPPPAPRGASSTGDVAPSRFFFFSSGAKGEHGSRCSGRAGGARIHRGRAAHSAKASPLVRLRVPAAVLEARLRQDRQSLVDQPLDARAVVLQNLGVEARAAILNAHLAAGEPPASVELLHVAPGRGVVSSAEGAARRAPSAPGCHGNYYNEFLN